MDLLEFLKQCLAEGKDLAKAQTEIKEFVEKNFVGKSKFGELATAKAELDKQIKERDKQLDDLKKNAGNKEALEQQIAELKEANKKAAADYEQKIKDNIAEYFGTLSFKTSEVSINRIGKAILDTADDIDYDADSLKINDGTENIPLTIEQIAVLGEVIISHD